MAVINVFINQISGFEALTTSLTTPKHRRLLRLLVGGIDMFVEIVLRLKPFTTTIFVALVRRTGMYG
jgi:hypothetical protein